MELEQRSSKPWVEGSNPFWDALSEATVLVRRGDRVCALVGEAVDGLSRYTCAGFSTDDGDVPWFPRNKPEPSCVGAYEV